MRARLLARLACLLGIHAMPEVAYRTVRCTRCGRLPRVRHVGR